MNNKAFGLAIKAQRKVRGMTAEELGKHIGVGRTYISKIEHGIFLPSDSTTEKIRKTLGLGKKFMMDYYLARRPDIVMFVKDNITLIEVKHHGK